MYFACFTFTEVTHKGKLNKMWVMLTIGAPLLLSVIPSSSKAFAVSSNRASSSNSPRLCNSVYLSTNLQVEIIGK